MAQLQSTHFGAFPMRLSPLFGFAVCAVSLSLLLVGCPDATPGVADGDVASVDAAGGDADGEGADALDTAGDAAPDDEGNEDSGLDADGLDDIQHDTEHDAPVDGQDTADTVPDGEPTDVSPDVPTGPWSLPSCTIEGTAALTFSGDEGATLAATTDALSGVVYAHGVVAADTPGLLWLTVGTDVLRSDDYGCTWVSVGTLGWSPMRLVKGIGDRAWAWSDNSNFVYRIDSAGGPGSASVVDVTPDKLSAVLGLGADATDPDRVRIGDKDGQILETLDAGLTWQPVGGPPPSGILGYRVAFDPANLDHVLYGRAVDGLYVTNDGGTLWKVANGLNPVGGGNVNAFNVVVSPVDRNVVWAMALDVGQNDSDPDSNGKHIFRSTDGGETFTTVVSASDTVTLINGPLMVPHPTDDNVLYFVFGTYFQGYGTDLFRYDAGSGALTKTHSSYHGIGAIAFPPGAPGLMYIGLEHEEIQ